MADMTDPEMAISLARMETKLDIALGDHSRRHAETEEDRKQIHAELTVLSRQQASTDARVTGLETRVGGAFSKYVPVVLSLLGVVISVVVFAYRA